MRPIVAALLMTLFSGGCALEPGGWLTIKNPLRRSPPRFSEYHQAMEQYAAGVERQRVEQAYRTLDDVHAAAGNSDRHDASANGTLGNAPADTSVDNPAHTPRVSLASAVVAPAQPTEESIGSAFKRRTRAIADGTTRAVKLTGVVILGGAAWLAYHSIFDDDEPTEHRFSSQADVSQQGWIDAKPRWND